MNDIIEDKKTFMKEIFENKKALIIIVTGALLIGGFIGWIIKPSGGHETAATSMSDHEAHKEQTWTCSMHPQIRQSEPGKCPIWEWIYTGVHQSQ